MGSGIKDLQEGGMIRSVITALGSGITALGSGSAPFFIGSGIRLIAECDNIGFWIFFLHLEQFITCY